MHTLKAPSHSRCRFSALLCVLALVLLAGGCAPAASTTGSDQSTAAVPSNAQPAATTQPALEGTIRVSGAFALYPMMQRWAEEFQKLHPQVRLDVSAGGAGKGMTDVLGGLVDIAMVSREIAPGEVQQGAVFVPVVKDTVVAVINANNPALKELVEKGAVKKTLVELWMQGTTPTWGELAGSSSTEAVQVYTRSDACGAAETWAKYLGGKQEDLKGTGVFGDPGIAQAVAQDTLGIGYSNLNYAYDATTGKPAAGLAVLPIDVNENGKVDPEEQIDVKDKTIKAILAGVYPSPPSRDLYLVAKGSWSGLTAEFVRWVLTDGQSYIEEVGYIKLPADTIAAAAKSVAP